MTLCADHDHAWTTIATEVRGDRIVEFRYCSCCSLAGYVVDAGQDPAPSITTGEVMEHVARHLGRPDLAPPRGWRGLLMGPVVTV